MVQAEQGWGTLGIDRTVQGNPLLDGSRAVPGFGTHAPGRLVFALDGRCGYFRVRVQLDREVAYTKKGTVQFTILGDGRKLFDSGIIKSIDNAPPMEALVDVHGVRSLELVSGDGGDGFDSDHADWLDPQVTLGAAPQRGRASLDRIVEGKGIALRVDHSGRVVGIKLQSDKAYRSVQAGTTLLGETPIGEPRIVRTVAGGLEIDRNCAVGARWCHVTEKFQPEGPSIAWQVTITSPGPAWSVPISTVVRFADPANHKLWMAWNDPVATHPNLGMGDANIPWNDPLVAQPFRDRFLTYGETPVTNWWQGDNWWNGDIATLPLVSALDVRGNGGWSLIQSPEDPMPVAQITTGQSGWYSFNRINRRLGDGQPVSFNMLLVGHRADPRAALAAFVNRFPEFFDPPNPAVANFGGLGAYSGDERPLDAQAVDRLKRMDFKTMWKLSDDYAYMGMFVPPVTSADQTWTRLDDSGSPRNYKPASTSTRRLNDYAAMLKSNGFHLLSYFNAVEFGHDLVDVKLRTTAPELGVDVASPKAPTYLDSWKNPSIFLAEEMPDAPLRYDGVHTVEAWQGGWALDPGDAAFQSELLAQAGRYIKWVPDSEGVCIDRLDYTCQYNDSADDGVTFHDGKPSRALVNSWLSLMQRLGPIEHRAGKVIFANFMNPRLDMARQLDGVYAEFGDQPTVVNGLAFVCLNKPPIAWTRDEDKLSDDFFQRYLYLGAFPTAPYPTNNHCIQPSPEHDRCYLDYGPLFEALEGRKWVLGPGMASAEGRAKLNLFSVPGGYAVSVTFAGDATSVVVHLSHLAGLTNKATFQAIVPGQALPETLKARVRGDSATVRVPVLRGGGVLKIQGVRMGDLGRPSQ
jgi:hypothetical protein